MNLFIKICISYIALYTLFKLIRWLIIDIIPNIESSEGKDTVRLLLFAFIGFSIIMGALRFFY